MTDIPTGGFRNLTVEVKKQFGASAPGFALDVSFSIPAGFTVLFGASGSGKTSTLDCIAGLTRPDSGHVAAEENVLFDSDQHIDVAVDRRRIGYVFQNLALFPHLTVERNIEYGIGRIEAAERRKRVDAILDSFRIGHLRKRRPFEISGGEKQRAALARCLVTQPRVLLLDEPLSALDAPIKSRLLDDLRAWNDVHQLPILYVTHSRNEVFALAERVIVLARGSVLAQGNPFEVLDAPRHETTAQLAGFENIFDAEVAGVHEDRGTMTCSLGAVELETPLGNAAEGAMVRIGIRAGDILLANVPPQGLSARNILPGRIASITGRDRMVVLQVDCGVLFEAHITPHARESLQLQPGREVWLVVKTHSCHLLRRPDAE